MEPSPSAPGRRRRILFVAEAASLAHVGRPAALAGTLDPAHDEAVFAVHRRCWPLLAGLDARLVHLDSEEPAAFARALAAGRPVFAPALLDRYVVDDLALLASERPDAVVGDFRLSLAVSARLLRVPYLALASAYWSPWARLHPCPAPVVAPLRPFGRLAPLLAPLAMPFGLAAHARVFAALARRHGLRPAAHGLRGAYTDGDLTGYCDPPGWIGLAGAPASHRCLGAPLWEPPVAAPGWLEEFTRTPGWIYVTLGSTGDPALLPAVLAGLARLGRPLAVATAGAAVELPPGAHAAPLLPGGRLAAGAALVVCNGGATAQQALAHGAPVLGLAGNLDQFLAMRHVEAHGCGRTLRADRATAARVAEAAAALIADPEAAAAARRTQALIAAHPPGPAFSAALDQMAPRRGAARRRDAA